MRLAFWTLAAITAVSFMSGCSGASVSPTSTLHTRYFSSRDGALQYRLPAGWFDATGDSSSSGNLVWLLREDYAATIAVQEIRLDEAARSEMAKGGLMKVAKITTMLATGDRPTLIRRAPEIVNINGREMCTYDLTTAAREIVRVVLLDTGGKVYSVTALAAAGAKTDEVFEAELNFASGLRW